MNLQIQTLTLENFKGVKNFTLTPATVTNVRGANGTGKTTLMDAFLWLLTGKDSQGRADYRVKPQSATGATTPDLTTSVTAEIEIESNLGMPPEHHTLTRTYAEKWQRKKGSSTAAYTGDETKFFFNGVPLLAKDYAAKVATLCPPDLLPVLTNVNYFSEQTKDYKARRELLFSAFGTVTQAQILASNPDLALLAAAMGTRTPDEYRAVLTAAKKPLNESLTALPLRIDEAEKSLPAPADLDALKKERGAILVEISTLSHELDRPAKQDETERSLTKALDDARFTLSEVESKQKSVRAIFLEKKEQENRSKLMAAELKRASLVSQISIQKFGIQSLESKLLSLQETRAKLLADYHAAEAREFDETDLACPTCGQLFPDDRRAAIQAAFNEQKSLDLQTALDKGRATSAALAETEAELAKERDTLAQTEQARDAAASEVEAAKSLPAPQLPADLAADLAAELESAQNAVTAAGSALASYQSKAPDEKEEEKNRDLKAKIQTLQEKSDALTAQILAQTNAETTRARIESYRDDLSQTKQRLDETARQLDLLDDYTRTFVSMVTEHINKNFSTVKWQLFEAQKNGGIKDICEATVNGIPYGTLNTAAKINAGLDIVAAFSKASRTKIPLFLDNRESVTSIPCAPSTQIINLFVDPTAHELTINKFDPPKPA